MIPLDEFFGYLNHLHPNIKFTTEMEGPQGLPFLNVFVYRKLAAQDLLKSTHTNLYLQASSRHYYPAEKKELCCPLWVHRVSVVSDANSLPEELCFVRRVFFVNVYSKDEVD